MSSAAPDKHPALVERLTKLCKEHSATCPTARKYLDMLTMRKYTDDDLNEIIEQFDCPCEICNGPHYTEVCPILQEETQCDECGTVCENSRALHEHRDQWGNCPFSIECANCEERHYTSDCPWCMECAKKSNECKCKSHESVPSSLAPTTQ
jgi:hypothetical protein